MQWLKLIRCSAQQARRTIYRMGDSSERDFRPSTLLFFGLLGGIPTDCWIAEAHSMLTPDRMQHEAS